MHGARAFHVVNNGGAGLPRQNIAGIQHGQTIGENVLPIGGDDAETITIAIEGQTEICTLLAHGGNQVDQIVRLGRIGVVIGECAVDFAVEFGHLRAQGTQHARTEFTRHAVAGIYDDTQGTSQLDIRGDAIDIVLRDIARFHATGLRCQMQDAGGDALIQSGDGIAGQRLTIDHDLETVVIGRIVRTRQRDARTGAGGIRRKISQRRGGQTDINHINAGEIETLDQALHQGRAGQTAIATAHDLREAFVMHYRTDGLPDFYGNALVQIGTDYPADVIGTEDTRLHGQSATGSIGNLNGSGVRHGQ